MDAVFLCALYQYNMSQYYVKNLDSVSGPFSVSELKGLVGKTIFQDSFVRKGDDGKWVSATSVNGLSFAGGEKKKSPTKTCRFCAEQIKASAIKCKHCGEMVKQPVNASGSSRKILVALLLLLFFGYLGIHAFYVGNKGQGITILVLSIISVISWPIVQMVSGIAFVSVTLFLILDFLRLVTQRYPDGYGQLITSWH